MHENRFLMLVTRKLSGEISPEEFEELEQMATSDPTLRHELDTYTRFWEQQQQEQTAHTERQLQKVLNRIHEEGEQPPVVKMRSWNRIQVAASLALLVTLSAGIYFAANRKQVAQSATQGIVQKQNAKGVKSSIELADGSKVWLNADSKIQYPARFTGNTREVTLNGEAFFDIAKNPEKPFIIHLDNGTVRVLGTSFNIKAYDNEKVVETSVATGKVAFIPKLKGRIADTIFINPENKIVFELATEEIMKAATVSAEDKAWVEGKLIFRSMEFEDIAVELERNFGKKVVFNDSAARSYRLTGSFQNNTLAEILYYLAKTSSFSYTISDEQIVISK